MGPTIASSLVHKINIKEPTTSVFVDCWVKRVIMLIGLDHRTICWAASQRRVRAAPKCSNPREVPSSRRTLIMVTFFLLNILLFLCVHALSYLRMASKHKLSHVVSNKLQNVSDNNTNTKWNLQATTTANGRPSRKSRPAPRTKYRARLTPRYHNPCPLRALPTACKGSPLAHRT